MVTSYLQLLERRYKGKLDQDADEFIYYAVDGAIRMQALINDLLSYSRVRTRGQPFQPVDCSAIVKNAIANLQVAIKESGAIVTHDKLPALIGDSSQLTQLFQNLIANAIKFRQGTPPQIQIGVVRGAGEDGEEDQEHKEKLQLLTQQPGLSTQWLFWVRDNGIGIQPQYAERIFLVFQRLHRRADYPGTGIGLAICQKIVERHGGRIWVESELGQGSIFYFIIPDIAGVSL
jgi:hypothetical protein